jgi:hypothetical protein
MSSTSICSEQFGELLLRSFSQLAMIWHCEPASGRISQNDMASGLMIECVANFAESFGRICA